MRKSFLIAGLLLSSFFGGALAQVIGGGINSLSAAVNWLALTGSVAGDVTGSVYNCNPNSATCYSVNQIRITSDALNAGANTAGPYGLNVVHNFGGGSMVGWAGGLLLSTLLTATTGNSGTTNYVGETNVIAANAPDASGAASLFGGNDNAQLHNGATSWLQLVGREIDVNANTGSSAQDVIGEQIVAQNGHAVAGTRSNIGHSLNNGDTAQSWDCGYCFGAYSGYWMLNDKATMIGCWPHAVARNGSGSAVPTSSGCGTALFGIDLSNVTFAAGGSPFVAPLLTPASQTEACRAGAIKWDATQIYVCTSSNHWKRAALSDTVF